MINIVIPMAGEGRRFAEAGYKEPKPMIDVCGKPMIERVIDSLKLSGGQVRYIFIAQRPHLERGLREILEEFGDIVEVDGLTEGAACTIMLARESIDSSDELIISNCDQYLEWDFGAFIEKARQFDGCLVTFNSTNPHHSYAKVNVGGLVVEVAEKRVISDMASAGIYYFNSGSLFVNAAIDMIVRNIRTNGEFYICPVYNQLLPANRIGVYEIDVNRKHMLGVPEELKIFTDKVDSGRVKL